jgi:hypothetical protein
VPNKFMSAAATGSATAALLGFADHGVHETAATTKPCN